MEHKFVYTSRRPLSQSQPVYTSRAFYIGYRYAEERLGELSQVVVMVKTDLVECMYEGHDVLALRLEQPINCSWTAGGKSLRCISKM